MREIFWFPLLATVCAFTSMRADLTIVQRDVGNIDSTYRFKDGRSRYDSPGASLIMDFKSGEVNRLMHPSKSYVKFPSGSIKALRDPSPLFKDAGRLTLTPTGKKDTISGYAVDEYTSNINAEGMKITLWLTSAMPDYANILKQMLAGSVPMPARWGLDMAALPGFPMRTSYEWQTGQVYTSTVLSINTEPIADSEFDIPADCKQEKLNPAILRPVDNR